MTSVRIAARRNFLLFFALAALLFNRFFLICGTNRLFEKGIRANKRFFEGSWAEQFSRILAILTPVEQGVIALTVLLVVFLMSLELRSGRLSEALSGIFLDQKKTVCLLLYLSLFSVAPFLSPGFLYNCDAVFYMFPSWYVSESLLRGDFSLFTNYFWGGYAYARLYGPLFFIFTGAVNLLLADWVLSVKAGLALLHLLSGIFMYLYLHRVSQNKAASLAGAVAYLFAYFRYYWVLNMGRLRYEMFFCFFPLLWYFADLYLEERKRKYLFSISLVLGGFMLLQPGPQTIHTFLFFALYAVLRIFFGNAGPGEKIKGLISLFSCFFFALLLSCWSFVDKIRDPHTVAWLFPDANALPAPTWAALFRWSPAPPPDSYGCYLGISLWVLSGLGAFWAFRKKDRQGMIFSLLFAFSLFLVFGTGVKGYRYLPLVHTLRTSEWFLIFTVFFMSVLCYYGFDFIVRKCSGRKEKIILWAGIIILLDLIPLTFPDFFRDEIPHGRKAPYEWIAGRKNMDKDTRVIDSTLLWQMKDGRLTYDTEPLNFHAPLVPIFTGRSLLNGVEMDINMPRTYWPVKLLIYCINDVNQEGFPEADRNAEFLKDALYLANVQYVINTKPLPAKLFGTVRSFEEGVLIGESETFSPMVASRRIRTAGSEAVPRSFEALRGIIESMGINRDAGTADGISVLSSRGPFPDRDIPAADNLVFELLSYAITNSRFEADYFLNQDAFLHVSQAFYDYMGVFLDGRPVKTVFETELGFIAVPAPRGTHRIVIRPVCTGLMRLCLLISGGTFAFGLWVSVFARRRPQKANVLPRIVSRETGA